MRPVLLVLICSFCTFFFISCAQNSNMKELKQEIIATDKAMSDLAAQKGFLKAILYYADENITKFNDGQYPIVGKQEYEKVYGKNAGPKSISWEPLYVDVAKSGELGYTWGNWKFARKDTTIYGNYFTVWKKQNDGKWKVALDGGNTTPPPVNKSAN